MDLRNLEFPSLSGSWNKIKYKWGLLSRFSIFRIKDISYKITSIHQNTNIYRLLCIDGPFISSTDSVYFSPVPRFVRIFLYCFHVFLFCSQMRDVPDTFSVFRYWVTKHPCGISASGFVQSTRLNASFLQAISFFHSIEMKKPHNLTGFLTWAQLEGVVSGSDSSLPAEEQGVRQPGLWLCQLFSKLYASVKRIKDQEDKLCLLIKRILHSAFSRMYWITP